MRSAMPRDKAERFGHWLKALGRNQDSQAWCRENGLVLTRAQGEGINTAGGFLVPDDFDPVVSQVTQDVAGVFRANTDVRRTTSAYQVRPRRYGDITVTYTGENESITESSFELDPIEITPKKGAALVRCSSELWEDSATDLGAYIGSELAYIFGLGEDMAAWWGDGTSTYGRTRGFGALLSGMASEVACAANHNLITEVDAADLGSAIAGVQAVALQSASWYLTRMAFGNAMIRIAVSSGGLFSGFRPDGTMEYQYLGFPVRFIAGGSTDAADDLTGLPMGIWFGDIRRSSCLVDRTPLTIAVSWHRALDTDEVLVRATRRFDIVHHNLGTAGDVGPVAQLIGT